MPTVRSTLTPTAASRGSRSRRRRFTSGVSTNDSSSAIAIGMKISRPKYRAAMMVAPTTTGDAMAARGVSAAATRVGRGGIREVPGRAAGSTPTGVLVPIP